MSNIIICLIYLFAFFLIDTCSNANTLVAFLLMYSEVSGNGVDGIYFQGVQGSADFIIQDTTINDNTGIGIFVNGADGSVTLKNVDASGNGNDGGENIKINGVLLNIE